MPSVTPRELAILNARREAGSGYPVREGWQGRILTIFVPGQPRHYKGKGHRFTVSKHTHDWRDSAATHLLQFAPNRTWPWDIRQPKTIAFTVYGYNAFDEDNLALVASGCRDACRDMKIIVDDRPSAGNTFLYSQITSRQHPVYGIAVRISLSPTTEI